MAKNVNLAIFSGEGHKRSFQLINVHVVVCPGDCGELNEPDK
jgi:hypothetical protein